MCGFNDARIRTNVSTDANLKGGAGHSSGLSACGGFCGADAACCPRQGSGARRNCGPPGSARACAIWLSIGDQSPRADAVKTRICGYQG